MSYRNKTPARAGRKTQLSSPHAGLLLGTCALFFWALVYPHPRALVLMSLMTLPLLAMLIYRLRLARDDADRVGWRQVNLLLPTVMLTVALLVRAMDERVIDLKPALLPALAAGCALAWLCRVGPGWSSLAIGSAIMSLYALGAIHVSNSLFDTRAPAAYLADIDKQYREGGRVPRHRLVVTPTPARKGRGIAVSADLYRQVEPGDKVCVLLHPGALGLPWYAVEAAARCAPVLPLPSTHG